MIELSQDKNEMHLAKLSYCYHKRKVSLVPLRLDTKESWVSEFKAYKLQYEKNILGGKLFQ